MTAPTPTTETHVDQDGVDQVLDDAVRTVRDELVRVDGKASTLLALASGGLAVLVAVAAGYTRSLPTAAAVAVWTAGEIGGAVGLLLLAIWPQMPSHRIRREAVGWNGTFGAYADADTPEVVVDHARTVAAAGSLHRAEHLRVLSRLVRIKYRALRAASGVLLAVLGVLAVGLVLTLPGGGAR